MDEIWIVYWYQVLDKAGHIIAYASTPEKAKGFAEKHFGKSLQWANGYGSYQANENVLNHYSVYPEPIDRFTEAFMHSGD